MYVCVHNNIGGGGSVMDSSGSQIAEGTRGFAGDVDAFQVEHYEHFWY